MWTALTRTALIAGLLAGCAAPAADQPAYHARMGRFIGLVTQCGCSDLRPDQVLAEYGKALGGRYDAAQVTAMKSYVDDGLTESFDNQIEICAETCAQPCMVNAVAQPLGGRIIPGVESCLVSERDLHLTVGRRSGPYPQ